MIGNLDTIGRTTARNATVSSGASQSSWADESRPSIPALTGVRFLAALCVFLGHMVPQVMPYPNPPYWYTQIASLAALGMTLFFVLSGFVIHYNYSSQIEHCGLKGIYNFFVARFARLYPLYIVLAAVQLLYLFSYSQFPHTFFRALPFYLSLTQTWLYYPLGKYGLIFELGILPTIAWSISTEWFFYVCYPLVVTLLKKVQGIRARLSLAMLTGVAVCSAVMAIYSHYEAVNAFGIKHFGPVGDAAARTSYSLCQWFIFYSPYCRIFEFLLGCICASIFLSCRSHKVSAREQRLGFSVLAATIICLGLFHGLVFSPLAATGTLHMISELHRCYGFAPFVAIIIFCCARYDNVITRLLSSWPMVLCGEASYSLYMLHMLVVYAARWESAPVNSPLVIVADSIRLMFALLSGIGLSLITWRTLEMPARRWLRNLMTVRNVVRHRAS
jgi:peptidoglycan/LPS O-acetylase OafA/YrhL